MALTSKTIAIIVIAVVVVAGVGTAFLTLNNSKEKVVIDAALEVYGNADNNDRIDRSDIDIIREIISGNRSFDDHPLADANYDGVVDEEDIEQVNKIINSDSDNKVRVYHINHHGTESLVADTLYPITSAIATAGLNSLLVFKYLGIVDELEGFSWSSIPDSTLYSEFIPLMTEDRRVSSTVYTVNVDKASNFVDGKGVTAMITESHPTYLKTETDLLEGAGIDVVRIQVSTVDSKAYMSTILLLAFLFDTDGKGYMGKCSDLVKWYEDLLTDLDSKIGGIKDRSTVVASSMTTYVSAYNSDYAKVMEVAGANYALSDTGSTSTSLSYNGASDTWLNAYEIDYLICLRGSAAGFSWYGGTALTDGAGELRSYADNFRSLECYENGNIYVICGEMPVMLRIAYTAQTLYGDVFSPDYAYDLHVDFVKKFFGWDESMIKGKAFVVSMEDLGMVK